MWTLQLSEGNKDCIKWKSLSGSGTYDLLSSPPKIDYITECKQNYHIFLTQTINTYRLLLKWKMKQSKNEADETEPAHKNRKYLRKDRQKARGARCKNICHQKALEGKLSICDCEWMARCSVYLPYFYFLLGKFPSCTCAINISYPCKIH